MAMVRKQIYIEAAQDREIKAEAKRRGVSEAEVIRERLSGRPETAVRRVRTPAEERAVREAIAALREMRARTKPGPGTGRKIKREEAYAERLDRIAPP
jgi:hypothetical protein